MSHPSFERSPALHGVLTRMDARGGVTLQGRSAGATRRWLRTRNRLRALAVGTLAVGVLLAVLGGVLHEFGLWALAIPLGGFLAFLGAVWLGAVLLMSGSMAQRLESESYPVTIDPHGIALRGIGPIQWSDVAPPQRIRVPVKNDIGGDCTVMPLTPTGYTRVNAQAGWWRNRVGPKPWLRADTPYLLLPGIEGLTEEETMHLFAVAHGRFAR